jgi:hypothetical protein
MAVPVSATYSVGVKEAAHISFRDLIDAGSSNGYVNIRDSSDVLLAQIDLSDPCGTVDAGTGQLTLSIAGPDTSADATGTAAYAEFCDSDANVLLSLPAQSGGVPVSGYIVINTLEIIAGGQVDIVSATIG